MCCRRFIAYYLQAPSNDEGSIFWRVKSLQTHTAAKLLFVKVHKTPPFSRQLVCCTEDSSGKK
jgi:hypothetical protein